MNYNRELKELKNWYTDYVQSFYTDDTEFNHNLDIKNYHTLRVCKEILDVGTSLKLNSEQLQTAEIIALLHDVGRFKQFEKYKTSVDRHSENHASLGVKVIRINNVLNGIDDNKRELILCAVAHHNKMEMPVDLPEECKFFTKLLRDADKLDIWRVCTDYYADKNKVKNDYIELGLSDSPETSEEVCKDLLKGSYVRTVNLQSLNDFKLLQMGWVYDINFRRSFQIIREREYLQKIYTVLPHTNIVNEIYAKLEAYLDEKCVYR